MMNTTYAHMCEIDQNEHPSLPYPHHKASRTNKNGWNMGREGERGDIERERETDRERETERETERERSI